MSRLDRANILRSQKSVVPVLVALFPDVFSQQFGVLVAGGILDCGPGHRGGCPDIGEALEHRGQFLKADRLTGNLREHRIPGKADQRGAAQSIELRDCLGVPAALTQGRLKETAHLVFHDLPPLLIPL